MPVKYVAVDDTTKKRTLVSAGGFTDNDFDVGGGGQTTFTIPGGLTVQTKVDVLRNGQLMREGASRDYQRNTGTGQIIFTYTVPQNSWIRVRVYA